MGVGLRILLNGNVMGQRCLAIQQYSQNERLWQEIDGKLDEERADIPQRLSLVLRRTLEHLVTEQVLLRRLQVYSVPRLHEEHSLVHKASWDARLDRNVASVEVHVPSLNAFDAHGSQRGKVLSEADGSHYLCDICGAWEAHYLQSVDV